MSDYDLAVYYYQQAVHFSQVANTLAIVAGVLALLLVICVGVCTSVVEERNRLRDELAQHSDPAHQLALVQELGEAGRREVRRLADEAQHAMLVAGGRR
jgi:glucose uptake protein GlcU